MRIVCIERKKKKKKCVVFISRHVEILFGTHMLASLLMAEEHRSPGSKTKVFFVEVKLYLKKYILPLVTRHHGSCGPNQEQKL